MAETLKEKTHVEVSTEEWVECDGINEYIYQYPAVVVTNYWFEIHLPILLIIMMC